jgi:cell shape-determining protein MreC
MAADSSVFGIVQPWRGPFSEQDRLILNGTPYHATLEAGTLITTSGLGGIYPRGIPVGVVEGVQEEEGRWRKSYWLRPVVEKGSVTHALVVRGSEAPQVIMELFREGGSGSGGAAEGGGGAPSPAPGRIR